MWFGERGGGEEGGCQMVRVGEREGRGGWLSDGALGRAGPLTPQPPSFPQTVFHSGQSPSTVDAAVDSRGSASTQYMGCLPLSPQKTKVRRCLTSLTN